VSNNNSWQSPGEATPGAPAAPAYGPGIPPISPQGTTPAPPHMQTPPPPTGWTPPPKPGLIPLQPLTLGGILAGSFQVMRRNPRPTFGASLIINGIIGVITILFVGGATYFSLDRVMSSSDAVIDDVEAGGVALTLISTLVGLGFALVGTAILQGIISLEVARATVGEKLRFRALWALARGRIGALIGWSMLIGVVVFLGVGIVTFGIVLLVVTMGNMGILLGVLVGIAAVLGGCVLGAWLGTRLSLVPSVLILERTKLIPAMRRSWSLTTGYFWRTFGIELLIVVIVSTAAQIVTFPVTIILSIVTGLTNPVQDPEAYANATMLSLILTTVVTSLVGAVTAIISSASTSLIYIDLRMRKEGLDLDLVRFVEARQGGDNSVADPYRAPASSGSDGNAQAAPASSRTEETTPASPAEGDTP